MAADLHTLSGEERRWKQRQLDAVRRFIDEFSPGDIDQPVSLGALDRAVAARLAEVALEAAEIDRVAAMAGMAFGEILVQNLGFRWVAVHTENVSELAVHALPGAGDVLIYPLGFTARHLRRRDSEFFKQGYEQIAMHLKSLRG
ncbi:MAG: DUF3806 domain-containing protein [Thermoguttaceae bacterium]|nr:DUF3806 domain-containing protein [Thermoguttaceae bacterium]